MSSWPPCWRRVQVVKEILAEVLSTVCPLVNRPPSGHFPGPQVRHCTCTLESWPVCSKTLQEGHPRVNLELCPLHSSGQAQTTRCPWSSRPGGCSCGGLSHLYQVKGWSGPCRECQTLDGDPKASPSGSPTASAVLDVVSLSQQINKTVD